MPSAQGQVFSNADLLLFTVQNGGLVDAQEEQQGSASGNNPLLGGSSAPPTGQGKLQRLTFGNGRQIVVYQATGGQWVVTPDSWQAYSTAAEGSDSAKAAQAQADLEGQLLANEQKRRDLAQGPAAAKGSIEGAFTDLDNTITYLQQQYASGKISADQLKASILQARRAFSDTLAGSTGYQRAKSAADWRQGNAQIGASLLNQRVSSGSGVLGDLLASSDQAVKLGAGPGKFNPFALAKSFVTDLGGGQGNYDIASGLLQGASGPAPSDPTDPASVEYWLGTPGSGDPGAPDDEDTYSSGPLPGGTSPTVGYSGASMPAGTAEPYDPLRYPGGY